MGIPYEMTVFTYPPPVRREDLGSRFRPKTSAGASHDSYYHSKYNCVNCYSRSDDDYLVCDSCYDDYLVIHEADKEECKIGFYERLEAKQKIDRNNKHWFIRFIRP